MILEMIVVFNCLAFALLVLGYWIKSKVIMFGGSAILLIVAAIMMLPDVFGGGIEYQTGVSRILYETSAFNFPANTSIMSGLQSETAVYERVNTAAAGLVGLVLLLVSLFIDYAVWLEEDLE